jgi:CheY-like chemotaxis protein
VTRVLLLPPGAPSPLGPALEQEGHDVVALESADRDALLAACDPAPDVIAVDLHRAPATGRDLALWLRARKTLRAVPLVFANGEPAFVSRLRPLVRGAVFTSSGGFADAVRRARAARAPSRNRAASPLAGYSGTPLPRKLGIRAGSRVLLLDAPDGFRDVLGALPERVELAAGGRGDVTLLFVRSRRALERRLPAAERATADGGRLWIAWPKRASGVPTDLAEGIVRALGLEAGLVDYKIAAIDATWSGLCFARRR